MRRNRAHPQKKLFLKRQSINLIVLVAGALVSFLRLSGVSLILINVFAGLGYVARGIANLSWIRAAKAKYKKILEDRGFDPPILSNGLAALFLSEPIWTGLVTLHASGRLLIPLLLTHFSSEVSRGLSNEAYNVTCDNSTITCDCETMFSKGSEEYLTTYFQLYVLADFAVALWIFLSEAFVDFILFPKVLREANFSSVTQSRTFENEQRTLGVSLTQFGALVVPPPKMPENPRSLSDLLILEEKLRLIHKSENISSALRSVAIMKARIQREEGRASYGK